GKTVWEILVEAGVQMTENAGCAACLGGPVDTFGRMNSPMKCISATNRNFPGRMGHKESQVFLASPMTVAASAIAGKIVDPRGFLSRSGRRMRFVPILAGQSQERQGRLKKERGQPFPRGDLATFLK